MSDETPAELISDMAYWRELVDLMGWRLLGWTRRESALLSDDEAMTLTLTGHQRDMLLKALKVKETHG